MSDETETVRVRRVLMVAVLAGAAALAFRARHTRRAHAMRQSAPAPPRSTTPPVTVDDRDRSPGSLPEPPAPAPRAPVAVATAATAVVAPAATEPLAAEEPTAVTRPEKEVEPQHGHRSRRPVLAGLALLGVGLVVALALMRAPADPASPPGTVLGMSTSQSAPAATAAAGTTTEAPAGSTAAATETEAAPEPVRATASTPVRARGLAVLKADAEALTALVGARVTAREARVDDVVGDRIFWVGSGEERVLVHLQGSGTRWAVRRGQRVSFTGVLTRTRPGAATAWGLDRGEGRADQQRQGHHLEVFGPNMRFDCVQRCG